jgi:hypothetical protein
MARSQIGLGRTQSIRPLPSALTVVSGFTGRALQDVSLAPPLRQQSGNGKQGFERAFVKARQAAADRAVESEQGRRRRSPGQFRFLAEGLAGRVVAG